MVAREGMLVSRGLGLLCGLGSFVHVLRVLAIVCMRGLFME